MPEPQTDARLAAQAMQGDRQGFAELVRRHQGTVYRIVHRILRDDAEAGDAAQEAFLKAFRNLASFDPTRPFAPWLYRIARNQALDMLRRKGASPELLERESATEDADDHGTAGAVGRDVADESVPDALTALEGDELRFRVAGALGALDAKYREVIELYHFENLKYDEIAQTLGIPIGTVMTRIHRARARLASSLKSTRAA